jgi:hypothetical protein
VLDGCWRRAFRRATGVAALGDFGAPEVGAGGKCMTARLGRAGRLVLGSLPPGAWLVFRTTPGESVGRPRALCARVGAWGSRGGRHRYSTAPCLLRVMAHAPIRQLAAFGRVASEEDQPGFVARPLGPEGRRSRGREAASSPWAEGHGRAQIRGRKRVLTVFGAVILDGRKSEENRMGVVLRDRSLRAPWVDARAGGRYEDRRKTRHSHGRPSQWHPANESSAPRAA